MLLCCFVSFFNLLGVAQMKWAFWYSCWSEDRGDSFGGRDWSTRAACEGRGSAGKMLPGLWEDAALVLGWAELQLGRVSAWELCDAAGLVKSSELARRLRKNIARGERWRRQVFAVAELVFSYSNNTVYSYNTLQKASASLSAFASRYSDTSSQRRACRWMWGQHFAIQTCEVLLWHFSCEYRRGVLDLPPEH